MYKDPRYTDEESSGLFWAIFFGGPIILTIVMTVGFLICR
jgi:hypothetical protein